MCPKSTFAHRQFAMIPTQRLIVVTSDKVLLKLFQAILVLLLSHNREIAYRGTDIISVVDTRTRARCDKRALI